MREAIAAKILLFAYSRGEENISDSLAKQLCNQEIHYLAKKCS